MYKLFMVLLFLLPITGMAQTTAQKNVMCFPFEKLMTALVTKFGEIAYFDALNDSQSNELSVVLMKNQTTGTWTIVEYDNKHTVGCILGAGTQNPS